MAIFEIVCRFGVFVLLLFCRFGVFWLCFVLFICFFCLLFRGGGRARDTKTILDPYLCEALCTCAISVSICGAHKRDSVVSLVSEFIYYIISLLCRQWCFALVASCNFSYYVHIFDLRSYSYSGAFLWHVEPCPWAFSESGP